MVELCWVKRREVCYKVEELGRVKIIEDFRDRVKR